MIVLGKNYHVSDNHIVVKPIAQIEDNQIMVLDRESRSQVFPNNGQIFTPSYHREITTGNFMIYELEASNTYEETNENSHYYVVKQTKMNAPLLEVYHLDESFVHDTDKIVRRIRDGFSSKIELLRDIIFQTSDHYILGPFRSEYDAENRRVKIVNDFEVDKYILPVYENFDNQLNISTYYDSFDEIKRSFTLGFPDEKNGVDELDIATEDYIVREAIRALKGREEFSDITRRVSQGINEWLKNAVFSEDYNTKRLKKTVELIAEIAPADDVNNYQKYTEELLSLPSVKSIIEEQKEAKFESGYEKFLKENSDVTNKNEALKVEQSQLTTKISTDQKKIKKLKQNIEEYTQFMSTKKENMEDEVLEHYFQQLITSHLSSKLSSDKMERLAYILSEEALEPTEKYESLADVRTAFKHNLLQYGERDIKDTIFNYCLIALKFNQPLIIIGESAFKLVEVIQKTFSAIKHQTIIPDTTHFSLNTLNDIKDKQNNSLNLTAIHNIHVSSAALNLTGFINAYESKETNNKMIFTFDSFDESRFVLEQLKAYSILDVNHRTFFPSPFESSEALKLGQLDTDIWSGHVQPVSSFNESMEEILEFIVENNYTEKDYEEIEVHLKKDFRRLIYSNQFLGKAKIALSYFPFLEENLEDDRDE